MIDDAEEPSATEMLISDMGDEIERLREDCKKAASYITSLSAASSRDRRLTFKICQNLMAAAGNIPRPHAWDQME